MLVFFKNDKKGWLVMGKYVSMHLTLDSEKYLDLSYSIVSQYDKAQN